MKNLVSPSPARRKESGSEVYESKEQASSEGQNRRPGKGVLSPDLPPKPAGQEQVWAATHCTAEATPGFLGEAAWGRNGRHLGQTLWSEQHQREGGSWPPLDRISFCSPALQRSFLSAPLLFNLPWSRHCHFREAVPVTPSETGSPF